MPQAIEIAAADGCVLRGQHWPGETAWVVLLHDVGPEEDLDRWRPLIPTLLAERLSVLAVDLRGHGASEGEWRDEEAVGDVAAIVRDARIQGAACLVVVAAGTSAVSAIEAAEGGGLDGIVGLSATGKRLPRGAGVPKLLIVGARDPDARDATDRLRAASIGWAVSATLPTDGQGTGLLAGSLAGHVREQIAAFVRERCFVAGLSVRGRGAQPASGIELVEKFGIGPKGDEG